VGPAQDYFSVLSTHSKNLVLHFDWKPEPRKNYLLAAQEAIWELRQGCGVSMQTVSQMPRRQPYISKSSRARLAAHVKT